MVKSHIFLQNFPIVSDPLLEFRNYIGLVEYGVSF